MSQSSNGSVTGTENTEGTLHNRRAIVLDVVAEEASPMSLGELTEKVAAREALNGDVDGHEQIAISLHHVDLPRMAEADIIRYDAGDRKVAPCLSL